ncbi:hypothetical protein CEXT_255451 [Caerostris extrusa]|uniref:ATP synthase F0 subunit 8 n=1 Tax=Caerostris extrusa TaxID=172846 RepID=A0AAV4SFL1_CAEEX|nr:hypothetical protein CEXT_255451 [Caerostris extrusa]
MLSLQHSRTQLTADVHNLKTKKWISISFLFTFLILSIERKFPSKMAHQMLRNDFCLAKKPHSSRSCELAFYITNWWFWIILLCVCFMIMVSLMVCVLCCCRARRTTPPQF